VYNVALNLCLLQANYGREDEAAVEKIKELYRELNLEQVFQKYEHESFQQLTTIIEGQTQLPEGVFGLLLKKIYKRSK
jgi:farnesyl diphosphate synthase